MTTRAFFFLLGTLCLASAGAQAEIYQYKDENGNTVFSERPPAKGAEAKIVKPKIGRPAVDAANKLQQDRERILPAEQADAKPADKKPALTPEQEEEKARACEQAQQALALLRENNRPRYRTEDGQIAHMTPEMQAERIADAEEKVGKYCEQ
ncbi:MAG: DUF4124 domain-containing protein [Gammaproteobacteria bacterium]